MYLLCVPAIYGVIVWRHINNYLCGYNMVDHFSALWGSRKSVRGNEISTEISQINVTVKEYGKKSLAELLAKAEAEEA